jgi:hypothetical protein
MSRESLRGNEGSEWGYKGKKFMLEGVFLREEKLF